ncbi:Bug family tripartite tricarboxylate transporter substrate binding protein [Hydrogenophaga sp. OTU3427]|uniref:Bug family tripartite tricarboxylate transporter substrate binding protein n=1 Tax=Hydrogenophaga sp. OTU3427 TaxID=3043856 RepID=UPI00313BA28F
MPHTTFTLARRTLLAAAALALAAPTWAQSFPTKPVKLVVPYPAGGPIDGVARGLAERLQRLWGQPVVVDNRGGANEIIAGDFTAKSPADGYTILLGADPTFSGNPFLFKKLPFNPFTDLVPITRVVNVNMAFIVPGGLPVNTLKEFVALIKANPNKYNYGSAGAGGPTHVQVDAFLRQEDLQMTHVAYKGIAPAAQDVLSGQVQAMVAGSSAATPHIPSGKMKVLAINGPKRAKALPNVPTFAEAGFPNTEMYFYLGLTAPKGVPKAIVDQIAADTRKVLADQSFVEKTLDVFGFDPISETPEQFAEFLKRDRALAEKKIRAANVSLD